MTTTKEPQKKEVWETIRAINDAWLRGRPGDATQYLAEDMVIVQPGFEGRTEGRAACLESFVSFSNNATVHDYKEGTPSVDIFGDTAVVSYVFDIAYEMGGTVRRESGRDLYICVRQSGRWLAAWRTLIPVPSAEPQ
jgi:hypothetical protein